jgi:hypothetical protein
MTVAFDQRQRAQSRVRISSRGWDPTLGGLNAGVGVSDLLQGGLRVPYAPTGLVRGEVSPVSLVQPYLFNLCSVGVGRGLWVTDIGLLSVIGCEQGSGGTPLATPIFPNVIQQKTANFRFSDCKNIRWGLRQLRKPTYPWAGRNPLATDSFAWRQSDNPALLFETATFNAANLDRNGNPDNYLTLTNYTAPAGLYVFPGRPVGGDLGCFDSLDLPYQDAGRKAFEPFWVSGSGQLALMAWVCQSNPTRSQMIVPGSFPVPTTGIPENAFLADWGIDATSNTGGAVQYSVGGRIEVEYSSGPGERVWSLPALATAVAAKAGC